MNKGTKQMNQMPKRDYKVVVQHPDKSVQQVVVKAVSQYDAMKQVKDKYPNAKMKSCSSSAW
jgi:hypothetical protein